MSLHRWENKTGSSTFSNPLELLYLSTAKYEGDWHSTLHAHQCVEIFYVAKGSGIFRVENVNFPVQKDVIVIVNSGVEHTEDSDPRDPLEYIVIGIKGSEFLLKNQQDRRYCILKNAANNRQILNYMQYIATEIADKKDHCEVAVHSALQLLAVHLLRSQSIVISEAPTSKTGLKCVQIKRYIDSHYKENITIDTLSKAVFLNRSYLIHIFTKEYGEPPISYLVKRRVAESRYLLAQTDYSISEIGLMVGFSSASYFSQSFNRIEGLSPKEYRRRAKVEMEKERNMTLDPS